MGCILRTYFRGNWQSQGGVRSTTKNAPCAKPRCPHCTATTSTFFGGNPPFKGRGVPKKAHILRTTLEYGLHFTNVATRELQRMQMSSKADVRRYYFLLKYANIIKIFWYFCRSTASPPYTLHPTPAALLPIKPIFPPQKKAVNRLQSFDKSSVLMMRREDLFYNKSLNIC